MSIRFTHSKAALTTAALLAASIFTASAHAGGMSVGAAALDRATVDQSAGVDPVRHRGGRGFSLYIGPSYGYGYGYYPRRSYYYPRYSYYDDGYYYRPYRRDRRWVRERFEHPLGRR